MPSQPETLLLLAAKPADYDVEGSTTYVSKPYFSAWLKYSALAALLGMSAFVGYSFGHNGSHNAPIESSPSPPPLVSKALGDEIPPSPFRTTCVTASTNVLRNPVSIDGFPATQKVITPFVDTYRQPDILPVKGKTCRSDGHCLMSYELDIYETQLAAFNNAIPDCKKYPATWWISYNGHVPGPTIRVPHGHESLVRFNNKIDQIYFKDTYKPCDANGRKGRPISVHNHGQASLAPFDGWAEDETCGGETKDYFYPNNRPTSGWYHDHALHVTADNAYLGKISFFA